MTTQNTPDGEFRRNNKELQCIAWTWRYLSNVPVKEVETGKQRDAGSEDRDTHVGKGGFFCRFGFDVKEHAEIIRLLAFRVYSQEYSPR